MLEFYKIVGLRMFSNVVLLVDHHMNSAAQMMNYILLFINRFISDYIYIKLPIQ